MPNSLFSIKFKATQEAKKERIRLKIVANKT